MIPIAPAIRQLEASFEIQLSVDQKQQLRLYLKLLKQWNRHINLSAAEGTADLLRFHFFEGFWAANKFLSEPTRVVDIGAGAGFPGYPMKLYCREMGLVLIEKNQKKAIFLQQVARTLQLTVSVFRGLAEDYGEWDSADMATLRAVRPSAKLRNLLCALQIRLLCFHGTQRPAGLSDWLVLKSAKVPLSRNRYVSLLQGQETSQ